MSHFEVAVAAGEDFDVPSKREVELTIFNMIRNCLLP